ncbi:TIGR03067 domain-containing protein [Rubripirellula reticaptiva]|uniref:TIGR03067 domain-containing protein n=1 Tax=Rubripirellula reticaptiva TaxID=2528013 RepID=A0A5C6EH90_9BACT|nr:TIGR03067 domain-containing protein [Rubripirellula reticaptiva]TWU48362.1 hypothetical protein Poly59_52080 [Rubripirellula reticaptiva]
MPIKITMFSFAFTALVVVPALAEDKPNDTIIEQLQGRWEITEGINQGRTLTAGELAGASVTITTNSIVTYDQSQQEKFRAVFTIDESNKPVHITMITVPKVAPVADETSPRAKQNTPNTTSPGILKLTGKSGGDVIMMLCYALPGSERPMKFESPGGGKNMLFVLKKHPVDEDLIEAITKE